MYYELNDWVQNPNKDYTAGVEMLSKLGGSPKDIQYLRTGQPNGLKLSILKEKLQRIHRIATQQGKLKDCLPSKPIEPRQLIIAKKTIAQTAGQPENSITRTKELTNKLLAYSWADLSDREKQYFVNEDTFNEKKQLYQKGKELRIQMSAVHNKLKQVQTDAERAELANELIQLQNEDISIWNFVDNFGEKAFTEIKTPPAEDEKPHNELLKLNKRLNNLRTYLSKTKKAIEGASEKDKEGLQAKLQAYQGEIEEIEGKING
jgi:hypothetical protein